MWDFSDFLLGLKELKELKGLRLVEGVEGVEVVEEVEEVEVVEVVEEVEGVEVVEEVEVVEVWKFASTFHYATGDVFLNRGTIKRLPSWTGGVPRQMSEANLARWGGGINLRKSTTPDSVSSPSAPRQMSTPPVQEGSL